MRFLLLSLALGLPALSWAQAPYSPKFARVATEAEAVWELCPKPEYPKSSQRNEETGTVTVRFTVAPTGHILNSTVVGSSGFRDLDRAAHGALSQCRFRPASIEGKPVQMTTHIQYVWSLD